MFQVRMKEFIKNYSPIPMPIVPVQIAIFEDTTSSINCFSFDQRSCMVSIAHFYCRKFVLVYIVELKYYTLGKEIHSVQTLHSALPRLYVYFARQTIFMLQTSRRYMQQTLLKWCQLFVTVIRNFENIFFKNFRSQIQIGSTSCFVSSSHPQILVYVFCLPTCEFQNEEKF